MTENTFWEHVVPKQVGSGSAKDDSLENVEKNEHDRVVLEMFMNKPAKSISETDRKNDETHVLENDNDQESTSGDMSVCTAKSVGTVSTTGSVAGGFDDLVEGEEYMMALITETEDMTSEQIEWAEQREWEVSQEKKLKKGRSG